MHSDYLKKTSQTAKRTATLIKTLVGQINSAEVTISQKESELMAKAIETIKRIGWKLENEAKVKKREEGERQLMHAKKKSDAKTIAQEWPQQTTLEKVALCVGSSRVAETMLSYHLATKSGESLRRALDECFEEEKDSLANRASNRAIDSGTPVAELMSKARSKFDEIRRRTDVMALADRFEKQLATITQVA